jgi:hypothetical protein
VPTTAQLRNLLDVSRALWGGEALVFRAYWRWSGRDVDTDLAWLARQCHKELVDGVLPRLAAFDERLPTFEAPPSVDAPADALEGLLGDAVEEYQHLRYFAAAHESIRPADRPALDVASLTERWRWDENDELAAIRRRHRREAGVLGELASAFTEGGGATLYAEGMTLLDDASSTDADLVIGEACRRVHADEVGHFSDGFDDVRARSLTEADLGALTELVTEQLRQRIDMRNAQFGGPLDAEQVQGAKLGLASPVAVDIPAWRAPSEGSR